MSARRLTVPVLLLLTGTGLAAWLSTGGESGSPEIIITRQTSMRTTFEVNVPGIELTTVTTDKGEFSMIELPGQVMAVLEEGRPRVPKVSVLLAKPNGSRVTVRAELLETRKLEIENVYPLQPPLLDGEEPGPLVYDPAFYSRDARYPDQDAWLSETGVWRELEVANIHVYPVKVNPAQGEVEVATRLRVTVDYSGGAYPHEVSEWMVPAYGSFIDNFTSLRIRPRTDYDDGVRYLVFCHQNWATHTWLHDSLLGWVKKRGYDTRVITKSSFTATEIRDSIRLEYQRHEPPLLQYVLLVGEHAEIPCGSYSGVGRSDYYYSDFLPEPGGDKYPEIYLGRLSPDSAGCLTNQVKKILKYQKDPPGTDNWLTRLTMNAHREQYPDKYSGCIRGIYHMPKPYYDFDTDTIMGQFQNNQAVFDAVNGGTGYMIYRGHGSGTAWTGWCGSDWDVGTTYQLQNGDLTPITHHFACICGDINIGTCLAEAWMRKYPGGGVSALAATQSSYTYPNHGQCSTVVRAVADTWTITVPGVHDYVGPQFHTGGIMAYMDAYIAKYWNSGSYPDNIYMYLTLGDPSTPAWSGGMPMAPDVNYPGAVPVGSYALNVGVTVGGQPVQDAMVCAWKPGEFYVVERTGATGSAVLNINALTPGQFFVTVSEGHAATSPHTPILPYEGTCLAQTGGIPYVMYLRHTVNDSPPRGNGDGSVNPGETIRTITWVKNWGDSTARSLVGTLRTSDAFVTMTESLYSFGDLPGRCSVYTEPYGYEFEVAAACTNGHLIRFDLELRDADDSVWMSRVYVRVGAPNLVYMSESVLDTISGGNGNGRLDPNETAELMVLLKNIGFGHANGVTAILKSGDARMTVTDSFGDYGQIMADSMAVNEMDKFVVVTGMMPPETEIPCTLYVSGAGGYAKTLSFSLVVGAIRAVDPTPDSGGASTIYWAYDDCDTYYAECPEFEWVDIAGIGTMLDLSDDQTVQVNLPSAFGPFVFYGRPYTQISVCGNGWAGPGYTLSRTYTEHNLPSASDPMMLGLVWDDLYPPTSGEVWYHHDADNHRFIVQWDSMPYYASRDIYDWFQLILYDTTVTGTDGNSEFMYQYLTANGYSSCAIGTNDSIDLIGTLCLFDGSYHRGTAEVVAGRAIKFTTDGPQVGVREDRSKTSLVPKRLELSVAPNPFHRTSAIRWQLPMAGPVRLTVYDVSGRSVRTLAQQPEVAAGSYRAVWDGRDDQGRMVAHGTYLYQLETEAGVRTTKAVLLR